MKNELIPLAPEFTAQCAIAGRAILTIVSKKTGQRFTFKCQKPRDKFDDPNCPVSVKVLTGADNENSYTFLGTIFSDGHYVPSAKSPIGAEAPSAKAFSWFWTCVQAQKLTSLDIYHHGRCCRCGRTLTVPESIQMGLGPECAQKGL